MSDKLYQIIIDAVIKEETRKATERLGFFNHLIPICYRKRLSSENFEEIYGGLLKNIIKFCEARLKNTIATKKRYEEFGQSDAG